MRRYFIIGRNNVIAIMVTLLWLAIFIITSNVNKFNVNTILSGELLKKRSFASSTFINSDGTYSVKSYPEHIHYLDNDTKRFEEIDHTLRWSFQRGGWYFKTHNFYPFLPQYADQWIEFRDVFQDKDLAVRFKPICSHVLGRLIIPEHLSKEGLKGITDYNCVIYDNAFAKGIDLILYFTQTKFIKAVRIKEKYIKPKDEIFDFEIAFPDDEDIFASNNDNSGLIILDFSDKKQYLYNTPLQIGKTRKSPHTYLQLQVWDEKNREAIRFRLFEKNGKRYLRKIINKEFLNNSKGDCFADSAISYYR
jgi:hypothetical protein